MTGEPWIKQPKLPPRCKVRIFKSRWSTTKPWLLVLPAYPTIESKRKAIRFPDHWTAFRVAMFIQDSRNRGDLT